MMAVMRSITLCLLLLSTPLFAEDLVKPPKTESLCSSLLLQVAQGVTENSVRIHLVDARAKIDGLRESLSFLREPLPSLYRELHETYLEGRPQTYLLEVGWVQANRAERMKPSESITLTPSARGFYASVGWNKINERLRGVSEDAHDAAIKTYAWEIKGGPAIRRYLSQAQSDAYMIEENLQKAADKNAEKSTEKNTEKNIVPEQTGMWALSKRFGELVRESVLQESLVEERATATMLRVINSRRKDAMVYYGSPLTQIEGSLFEAWKGRVETPEMEKATRAFQERLTRRLVLEDRILSLDETGNPTLIVFFRIGSRRALLSPYHSY